MRRFPVGHEFFFAPEEWGGYVVFFGGGEDDGSSIYSVLGQVSNFDVGPCLFNLSICLSTYGIWVFSIWFLLGFYLFDVYQISFSLIIYVTSFAVSVLLATYMTYIFFWEYNIYIYIYLTQNMLPQVRLLIACQPCRSTKISQLSHAGHVAPRWQRTAAGTVCAQTASMLVPFVPWVKSWRTVHQKLRLTARAQ